MSAEQAAASRLVIKAYLRRLEYSEPQIVDLIAAEPCSAVLNELYTRHIMTIPFENMSQHSHPSEGDLVPACPPEPPTLDIDRSLHKLAFERRGGFCWELNFGFCWLLRSLGYAVRLANSYVYIPQGIGAGHLVLLVDGVHESGTLLLDPGFGDPPRVPVPLATCDGEAAPVSDSLGNTYRIERTEQHGDRWTMRLVQQRAKPNGTSVVDIVGVPERQPEPMEQIPVYVFNHNDDLDYQCEEFKFGLFTVLEDVPTNLFNQKRFATRPTNDGHVLQGRDYFKVVVHGEETERISLTTEAEYRQSLVEHFDIHLT